MKQFGYGKVTITLCLFTRTETHADLRRQIIVHNKMHILLGIHTAGKTSVGLELSKAGFVFFPELALEMIRNFDALRLPWNLDSSFDEMVMVKELERDNLLRSQLHPFFVETWHIGNLAYARIRNPGVAEKYDELIRTRIREFEPFVYFLDISPDIVFARTLYFADQIDRVAVVEFYSKVRAEFMRVLDRLSLDPLVIDASKEIETIVKIILQTEQFQGCIGLSGPQNLDTKMGKNKV